MGKALFGLELPAFGTLYAPNDARRGELVAGLIDGQLGGFEACEPRAGAVALFRIVGLPCHVGLCLGNGQMLHVLQGCSTVQASLLNRPWAARLVGTFAQRVIS
jgi:cell wall-associated NlpC family hydrolase